jgi:hypothetical protein
MKCVYTFLWLSFPCLEIQSVYTKLLSADRAKYRKADIQRCQTDKNKEGHNITAELAERQQNGHHKHRRVFHRSKTSSQTIQRLRPIQVYGYLFVLNDLIYLL